MKKYMAGNWLRSFFSGDFESIEEAWKWLSKRFMLSYPADMWDEDTKTFVDYPEGQRYIYMFVQEKNKYGITEWVTCKESSLVELSDLDKEEVLARCKHEGGKFM